MGQKYLIDTCAVIKYLDEVYPPVALAFMDGIIDLECNVSFITKIELLAWTSPNPEDIKIRHEFLSGSKIQFISNGIIDTAIQIRKETKIKLPDAVIAATAITNDFILISDNDKDFLKVKVLGLLYMNPKTSFSEI